MNTSDKHILRKSLLAKRSALSAEELAVQSEQLCRRLLPWLRERGIVRLGLYRSFREEISLRRIEAAWSQDELYYPRINSRMKTMDFHRAPLVGCNRFGIEEPAEDAPRLIFDAKCALLVPGLAFDRHGHRIGYGAGYYDRYLAAFSGLSMGICLDAFLFASLPHESHDRPVQHVATEVAIY